MDNNINNCIYEDFSIKSRKISKKLIIKNFQWNFIKILKKGKNNVIETLNKLIRKY